MGILSWIILGLIAGILAKFIMPGKDGGGFIVTTLLGIVGAFVGGYAGSFFGLGEISGLNLSTLLTATAGAFIVLFAYRMIVGNK